MSESEFDLDLDELSSAEDFLEYFAIDFDPAIVYVNRLHILQRFHDYVENAADMPEDDDARYTRYAELLAKAYGDFVVSNAQTEKVFKVFRMNEPVTVEIPLMDLAGQVASGAAKV